MSKVCLILDVSYLAHRAFHTTGSLMYEGEPTGVMYGVLRDIKTFTKRYGTEDVVFCFDSKRSLRKERFPYYKANRATQTSPAEARNRNDLRDQINLLRDVYLPAIGYHNLFIENGYEADDLIARTVRDLSPAGYDVIVVAADADLYQLLWNGVKQHRPGRGPEDLYDGLKFIHDYHGCMPYQWPVIKAIAGEKQKCGGDNIPGCPGVGIDSAARYVAGKLADGKRCKAIDAWKCSQQYHDNLALVKLPYEGCPAVQPYGQPPLTCWNEVCESLGMTSLVDVRRGLKRR